MEYVRLGKSGLKVSKVILGAMSFGQSPQMNWTIPEEQALPIIKHAYDQGVNTWDTADMYSFGDSERIIGKALKKYDIPRHRVVIMSKCFGGIPENPEDLDSTEMFMQMSVNDGVMVNQVGLSRKHVFDAVNASVARLGTYIDVLQIHRMDTETSGEEIMKALNDIVESGKARYIGASSMAAWEFQTLQNIAKQNGWHQFISMQDYHSLLYREGDREMNPYCRATGVGLVPWSPLARGLLTRPFRSQSTKREVGDAHFRTYLIGDTTVADEEIIGRVKTLADAKGVKMAIIALVWSLKKGFTPIVGLGSVDRVDEAVKAVSLANGDFLTDEDMVFLDEKYVAKFVVGR